MVFAEYSGWNGKNTDCKELETYVELWKDDKEYKTPQQVVDQLKNPTCEVVLPFQEHEVIDRHLVEIRQYKTNDHQLWRDGQFVKQVGYREVSTTGLS